MENIYACKMLNTHNIPQPLHHTFIHRGKYFVLAVRLFFADTMLRSYFEHFEHDKGAINQVYLGRKVHTNVHKDSIMQESH